MSSEYVGAIEKAIDLWSKEEYVDAMFALEQALEMPDADHRALEPLLVLYRVCGEPDNAVRLFGTMARNGVSGDGFATPEVAYHLGLNLVCLGAPAWPASVFFRRRFASRFPCSPLHACLLAHYCYERKRHAEAVRAGLLQRELGGDCSVCHHIVAYSSAKLEVEGPPYTRQTIDLRRLSPDAGTTSPCHSRPSTNRRFPEPD